jgi:hypothetical protein
MGWIADADTERGFPMRSRVCIHIERFWTFTGVLDEGIPW